MRVGHGWWIIGPKRFFTRSFTRLAQLLCFAVYFTPRENVETRSFDLVSIEAFHTNLLAGLQKTCKWWWNIYLFKTAQLWWQNKAEKRHSQKFSAALLYQSKDKSIYFQFWHYFQKRELIICNSFFLLLYIHRKIAHTEGWLRTNKLVRSLFWISLPRSLRYSSWFQNQELVFF